MWHNGASYRATCTPASFPVERSADLPPVGSGCGRPYPPPVHDFGAKVHVHRVEFDLLDSTPIVGPDAASAPRSATATAGSSVPCAARTAPSASPCETWRVGVAEGHGPAGPDLDAQRALLHQPGQRLRELQPTNQYQLLVYLSGTYRVCAENGACGEVTVTR